MASTHPTTPPTDAKHADRSFLTEPTRELLDHLETNLAARQTWQRLEADEHARLQIEHARLRLEIEKLRLLDRLRLDAGEDRLAYAHAVQRGRARALDRAARDLEELLEDETATAEDLEALRDTLTLEAEQIAEHARELGRKATEGGQP